MSGDQALVEPCYITANHHYAFRSGRWAEVAGVKLVNKRPCYFVLFDDGKTDLWAIDDAYAEYEFSAKRFVASVPSASDSPTDRSTK